MLSSMCQLDWEREAIGHAQEVFPEELWIWDCAGKTALTEAPGIAQAAEGLGKEPEEGTMFSSCSLVPRLDSSHPHTTVSFSGIWTWTPSDSSILFLQLADRSGDFSAPTAMWTNSHHRSQSVDQSISLPQYVYLVPFSGES